MRTQTCKNAEKWHTLLCMSIFFCIFAADFMRACVCARYAGIKYIGIADKKIQYNGRSNRAGRQRTTREV